MNHTHVYDSANDPYINLCRPYRHRLNALWCACGAWRWVGEFSIGSNMATRAFKGLGNA